MFGEEIHRIREAVLTISALLGNGGKIRQRDLFTPDSKIQLWFNPGKT
jgi:hypothetical protein